MDGLDLHVVAVLRVEDGELLFPDVVHECAVFIVSELERFHGTLRWLRLSWLGRRRCGLLLLLLWGIPE